METVSAVDVATGLLRSKDLVRQKMARFGECAVIVFGLPASGKSTLLEALHTTGFGDAVDVQDMRVMGEIPFGSHSDDNLFHFQLFSGAYPSSIRDKLFLATSVGVRSVQDAFAGDERFLYISLSCNFPTKVANLIPRSKEALFDRYQGDSLRERMMASTESFIVGLFPTRKQREAYAQSRPDVYISTSLGNRLSPVQMRRTLLSAGSNP